jgi:hypothetical protein
VLFAPTALFRSFAFFAPFAFSALRFPLDIPGPLSHTVILC